MFFDHAVRSFILRRQSETHQQPEAVVSLRRTDGEIRMERERRESVLVVPDAHAGLGSGQPSVRHPVSPESVDASIRQLSIDCYRCP